jgi:pentapeptide repeat protein
MLDESIKREAWDRLVQGRVLDDLSLGTRKGRVDLGGIALPDIAVLRRYQTDIADVAEVKPGAVIRGRKWQDLDFTGSKLNGIRLFDCEVQNCLFDECQLEDFRVWSSSFSETSFRSANLRKAALGGVQDGRRNSFEMADFSKADLRQSVYTAASFDRCIFRNAKLVKVDFQTSAFSNCEFEGELREVIFCRRGFRGDAFPANEMTNVDFSQATLHFVEFRGLDLDHVRFPDDTQHIIIKNYVPTLDRMIEALRLEDDPGFNRIRGYLESCRKWAGPKQVQGVINVEDLKEIAGEEAVKRVLHMIQQFGSRTN